jgi:hypothetical protein
MPMARCLDCIERLAGKAGRQLLEVPLAHDVGGWRLDLAALEMAFGTHHDRSERRSVRHDDPQAVNGMHGRLVGLVRHLGAERRELRRADLRGPNLVDSFIAWATFSLYSVAVLLIPYRRGERWSRYLTWALPVPSVVLRVNNSDAAPYYLTAVGLMVIGQILTRSAFFPKA